MDDEREALVDGALESVEVDSGGCPKREMDMLPRLLSLTERMVAVAESISFPSSISRSSSSRARCSLSSSNRWKS